MSIDRQTAIETWRGAFVPVVTVYHDDLRIDHDAIRDNVCNLIDRGAHTGNTVILAVGAGGDFPVLTPDERKAVAETILDAVAGRVPVVVGCQSTSTALTVDLAAHAARAGAQGVQVSPPYYYMPSDNDTVEFIEAVNDAADVGIMLYYTWWLGHRMSFDLIDRLLELPRVVSIKWSAPDVREYRDGFRRYADQVAVVDNMVCHEWSHLSGAVGFITHVTNFWPEHEWRVFELLEARRYHEAEQMVRAFNAKFMAFRHALEKESGGEGNAVKLAMDLSGLRGGPSRPPTRSHAVTPGQRDRLRAHLAEAMQHASVPSPLQEGPRP